MLTVWSYEKILARSLHKIVLFLDTLHRPVFYLKQATFRRPDSVSVFRWNLVRSTQSMELVLVFWPPDVVLSIGSNWAGSAWRQRQNPVSETLLVLSKSRTMDNVQKHNNVINIPSLQTLNLSLQRPGIIIIIIVLMLGTRSHAPRTTSPQTTALQVLPELMKFVN
jgi:hypothetical protein